MSKSIPSDRINYSGDLNLLIDEVCQAYQLGKLLDYKPIETGYEDFNVKISTSNGLFLAKMLSSERTPKEIERYANIISKVAEAGINHPKSLPSPQQGIVFSCSGVEMIVSEFIEGKTFFELGRSPNDTERQAIIKQAAKINSLDYKPPFYDDSWSVTNIRKMYAKVRPFLNSGDQSMLEKALERYDSIPVDLPRVFVHGDIITTNVVKGDDGEIYILDFSVANWYPRIQELAVIASSLLSGQSLRQRCQLIVDDYDKIVSLQPIEKQNFYDYALAAVAMELIGAYHAKQFEDNNSSENDYWLNLGRQELARELADIS